MFIGLNKMNCLWLRICSRAQATFNYWLYINCLLLKRYLPALLVSKLSLEVRGHCAKQQAADAEFRWGTKRMETLEVWESHLGFHWLKTSLAVVGVRLYAHFLALSVGPFGSNNFKLNSWMLDLRQFDILGLLGTQNFCHFESKSPGQIPVAVELLGLVVGKEDQLKDIARQSFQFLPFHRVELEVLNFSDLSFDIQIYHLISFLSDEIK